MRNRPSAGALWAVVLLVTLWVAPVAGVKKFLFKTCEQDSFCKRNRHYADKVSEAGDQFASPYSLDPASVAIEGGVLRGTVLKTIAGGPQTVELPLEVSALASGTFRVSMDERKRMDGDIEVYGHERVNPARFNVSAYLQPFDTVSQMSHTVREDGTIEIENGANSVEIRPSPLRLTFYRDGDVQIVLNERSFLNFEHYRPIEGPESEGQLWQPYELDAGLWEDEHDGKKDKKSRGPEAVAADVTFVGYSHVYGIPEHADRMSLRETRKRAGDGDEEKHSEPYRLYNVDIFEYETNSPMAMYGSIPFMTAQKAGKAAGVFWANAADTFVDIEKDGAGTSTHWMSEAGLLDVFVFMGDTPGAVNERYAEITGLPQLPQLFAMGYHQCRWNYNSRDDVLEVHSKFDEHSIPYDVIWLDIEYTDAKKYFTWNKDTFPDHVGMAKELDKTHRKLVPIIDPHIKLDSSGDYDVIRDLEARDLVVHDSNDNQYKGHCWPGESKWIDTMGAEASEHWKKYFAQDYAQFAGDAPNIHIWNDMNEPSVFSGPESSMERGNIHVGGWEHRDVHNVYGLTVHNATLEALKERYDGQQRPFILTRSYYAGSQTLGAMWTGDNMAKWEYLQAATPMILTQGIAGMPFAGADVGGFFGNPSSELLTRWYQAGVFYPFFRAHAHIDARRREPWIPPKPYSKIIADAIRLRYALLPTIYTAFHRASVDGTPIMMPLFYQHPDNAKTYGIDDQFYLSTSGIMVKPVTAEDADKVELYIPDGKPYYDLFTFAPVRGEGLHTVSAPLEKTPAYLRGGHIHARRERHRRSSELMKNDPYTLYVALDDDQTASGDIYVDDYVSYDYERGAYAHTNFTFSGTEFSSKPTHSDGGSYASVPIERIVLIGLRNQYTTATLRDAKGRTATAQVIRGPNGSQIVRNPRLPIAGEWTISLS